MEKHSGQQVPAQGEQGEVRKALYFEPMTTNAQEELRVPMESRPPRTAEDLLREEAIEATFNPGLWEPETSLHAAPDMGETTDAPAMGESSKREI